VTGHTDSIGSKSQNKTISQKRAEEITKYLIEKGIHKWRIKSIGYGEQYPKVNNVTPENRKINRRIEVYLVVPEKA
ncbi:MAG: OOP family OmpA-OmpF porin, partial [Saprospiraceae bacterium]